MRPRILAFAGQDPSGAAGLQADIETAVALNVSLCALPSALTVQDTAHCLQVEAVEADFLRRAADQLLASFRFQALKFGLLPDGKTVSLAAELAQQMDDIPVVTDPVLNAGGGEVMALAPASIAKELVPRTTVLTPNTAELQALTGETEVGPALGKLHATGCRWILVTAADVAAATQQAEACHLLSGPEGVTEFRRPLLPGRYRGSGCTLATAVAAFLAGGLTVPDAVRQGLDYCEQALQAAEAVAEGLYYPVRRSPQ